MDCINEVGVTTEFISAPKKQSSAINSDYRLDLWREVSKRWMVVGVFLVTTLSVLGPRFGAPGGLLHTEYLSYLPLIYIYYSAGVRIPLSAPTALAPARLLAVSCAHAHAVAPALCVAVVTALRDVTDYRVVKGALYSSVGGPCAWLSLALCHSDCAASIVAVNYIASLVAVPLSMLILCGRATFPSHSEVASTFFTTLIPFAFGALCQRRKSNATTRRLCDNWQKYDAIAAKFCSILRQLETTATKLFDRSRQCDAAATQHCDSPRHFDADAINLCGSSRQCDVTATKLCALALLYVECCERLRESEGILYVGDVLVTLILELTWLVTSAAACWVYARCGLISREHSRTVALCSVPKAMHTSAPYTSLCSVSGLSGLPAVFIAPARAVILASIGDE